VAEHKGVNATDNSKAAIIALRSAYAEHISFSEKYMGVLEENPDSLKAIQHGIDMGIDKQKNMYLQEIKDAAQSHDETDPLELGVSSEIPTI